MNQDGTPVKAVVHGYRTLQQRSRLSRRGRRRASRHHESRAASPGRLSPEKYNSWRNITFNFDPRDY